MRRIGGGLVALVFIVFIEVSTAAFLELQRSSTAALQARFELSSECEPTITAMASALSPDRFVVLIDCLPAGKAPLVPSHLPGP